MTGAMRLLERVREILSSAGVEWSPREPEWLLEAAGERKGVAGDVAAGVEARALELARRRARGEPLQYVTGVAGFRRLELEVGPGVLVPRAETELVAERAMQLLPPSGLVVDVGTGSGAIALAIADERPDAEVWATDMSSKALGWARRNAQSLALTVEFAHGHLLDACPRKLRGGIDVVVANLPYVAASERGQLPAVVVDHEPHEALFAGSDGLSVIGALARQAPAWLAECGWLVLEIGYTQAAPVRALLDPLGYRDVAVHRDLAGRDRVVQARRPS